MQLGDEHSSHLRPPGKLRLSYRARSGALNQKEDPRSHGLANSSKTIFLPYSKLHKKTYPDDVLVCNMLFETFGSLSLTEITPPMIEKFKQKRLEGETMYKRK